MCIDVVISSLLILVNCRCSFYIRCFFNIYNFGNSTLRLVFSHKHCKGTTETHTQAASQQKHTHDFDKEKMSEEYIGVDSSSQGQEISPKTTFGIVDASTQLRALAFATGTDQQREKIMLWEKKAFASRTNIPSTS